MNEIISRLYKRKSVRVYADKQISSKDKTTIIDCAIQAPSAGNLSLYSIIDITDEKIKKALSISCDNQPFIEKAPMLLLFAADYKKLYDVIQSKFPNVRKPDIGDLFLAYTDAVIAAQNAVVAADALGIGSCYIGDILENYETVKELLNLKKYTMPAALVCFGYPSEGQLKRAKPIRTPRDYIISKNTYEETPVSTTLKMLEEKHSDNAENIIKSVNTRKFSAPFALEMSASVKKWIQNWLSD